jgi:hypothetical protein
LPWHQVLQDAQPLPPTPEFPQETGLCLRLPDYDTASQFRQNASLEARRCRAAADEDLLTHAAPEHSLTRGLPVSNGYRSFMG